MQARDHLAQIVRRDVGRHADRDAAGAVDQHVGEARRQDLRLVARSVIIGGEIDRVLVDIVEQGHRHLGEPRLGVAHRRRRIGVHRSEIALAVDQRHPHRPILGHPGERVVDRAVAVRVIIAHHVADDLGAFAIGPARRRSRLPGRRRGCGGGPASARRARRAARGRRSRTSRNRDRRSSSRRRWRWGRCRWVRWSAGRWPMAYSCYV